MSKCNSHLKVEKEIIDCFNNGSISAGLGLLKKCDLQIDISKDSMIQIISLLHRQFDNILDDFDLLKPTVDLIAGFCKSFRKPSSCKSKLDLSKLHNLFLKCEQKSYFKESLSMLISCLTQYEYRLIGGTKEKDFLDVYRFIWLLANDIDSRKKNPEITPQLIFRLRLLALVISIKSQNTVSNFISRLKDAVNSQKISEIANEKDLAIVEEMVINFSRRADVSCNDVIQSALVYVRWVTKDPRHVDCKLRRIGAFFCQLRANLKTKECSDLNEKSFSQSIVTTMLTPIHSSCYSNPKFKMSPVDLFLSSLDESDDKENTSTPGTLIDFVLDVAPRKIFQDEDAEILTHFVNRLGKYLACLASISKSHADKLEFVLALVDFSTEIVQTSSDDSKTSLLYKIYGFVLNLLMEQDSSVDPGNTIFYFKKKLKIYLELISSNKNPDPVDAERESTKLTEVISSPSFQTSLNNVLAIATEFYRIGRSYYVSGNYVDSLHWFRCCLQLYKSREVPKEGQQQFRVVPCYEHIADCLRKLNRCEEALQFLAEGVLVDASFIVNASRRWVMVISDMTSKGGNKKCSTLASAVKSHLSDDLELKYKSILMSELEAIKNYKDVTLVQSYHELVLDELYRSDDMDQLERCEIILERAKSMRSVRPDAATESLNLCNEVIKQLDGREISTRAKDVKAQALVLSFVCAQPTNNEELDLEGQLNKLDNLKFGDDNINSNEREKDSTPPTLADEWRDKLEFDCSPQVSLQALEDALDLWSGIFTESSIEVVQKSINLVVVLEFVEVLSFLLRLHQHPKQMTAFQLLHQISTTVSDTTTILWCSTFVAEHYLELGQVEVADRVISGCDDFATKLSSESRQKHFYAYILYLSTKCRILFAMGCYKEGAKLIRKLGQSCQTPDKLLTRHRLYLILSDFCLLSDDKDVKEAILSLEVLKDSTLKRGCCGTRLEWLVKAVKWLNTALPFVFNKSRDYKSSMKFLLVNEFIATLTTTARCFVRCGLAREAHTYLLNGMVYSQAFRLRKRICETKLEFSHLAMLKGKIEDSSIQLSSVEFLLNNHQETATEVATSRKITREEELMSTPANYKLHHKSLYLDLNDEVATPISAWKTSPEQCKFPSCWSELTHASETLVKSKGLKVRSRSAKKDEIKKCRFCDDLVVRSLQLWCMVGDCEVKLKDGKKSLTYVKQFLEKIENLSKDLVGWTWKKLDESKGLDGLPDAFGLKKFGGLFDGERLYSNLFDRIEILKVRCAFLREEKIKLEKNMSQNITSLKPSDSIDAKAVESILLKILGQVRWPSRTGRYLSDNDLQKAVQYGGAPNDAIFSPKSTNKSSSSMNKDPFLVNAPVKKSRRAILPKLEMAQPSDTPLRGKLPKRMNEIDPSFLEEFEMFLSMESPSTDTKNLREYLKQLLNLIKYDPPALLYREICQSLALMSLEDNNNNNNNNGSGEADDSKAAYYFCEALSVSLRHATLLNIGRKLKNFDDSTEEKSCNTFEGDISKVMEKLRKVVEFKGPKDWSKLIDSLPKDWTICQLNLVSLPGEDRSQLFVTRMSKNSTPLVIPLPHMTISKRNRLIEEWESLMRENKNSMNITARTDYVMKRRGLDHEVKDWLESFEETWFSGFIGSMAGKLINNEDINCMGRAVDMFLEGCPVVSPKQRRMVEVLLTCSHLVKRRGIIQALSCMADQSADRNELKQYIPLIDKINKKFNFEVATRGPVLLVLDKDIQHLPLENLPGLERQQFTRHLNFHSLMGQYSCINEASSSSILRSGVNRRNTYYVVNPDNNLKNTEAMFGGWFEKEPGWEGVVGRPPTSDELSKNLSVRDLYVYCGHGSGAKYLKGEDLQRLICKSVVMLVGCSSGRLWTYGAFEPAGMLVHYFLMGAAPVVYGFPVLMKES